MLSLQSRRCATKGAPRQVARCDGFEGLSRHGHFMSATHWLKHIHQNYLSNTPPNTMGNSSFILVFDECVTLRHISQNTFIKIIDTPQNTGDTDGFPVIGNKN